MTLWHWLTQRRHADRELEEEITSHLAMATQDRIAGGEVNAMAAILRGAITVEGDPALLLMFQRLLPGPQAHDGDVR